MKEESKKTFFCFAKPGDLVKIENNLVGRIAHRNKLQVYKVTDLNYLTEILNQFTRFLSLRPETRGSHAIEKHIIDTGCVGLYLGTIHLDDYYRSSTVLHVYRVILLGNAVYVVKADCVISLGAKETPA